MGVKTFRDETGVEQTLIDPEKETKLKGYDRSAFIDGLLSKTFYTFNITAFFHDGNFGPVNTLKIETTDEGRLIANSVS